MENAFKINLLLARSLLTMPYTLRIRVPQISRFEKILGGGDFSHYLVCSDLIGERIIKIKKFLGVANPK